MFRHLYMRDNFCDFLFVFAYKVPSEKGVYSKSRPLLEGGYFLKVCAFSQIKKNTFKTGMQEGCRVDQAQLLLKCSFSTVCTVYRSSCMLKENVYTSKESSSTMEIIAPAPTSRLANYLKTKRNCSPWWEQFPSFKRSPSVLNVSNSRKIASCLLCEIASKYFRCVRS